MISKEAFELVQRLNDLKHSESGKQAKKIRTFLQSINDYQVKTRKCMTDLNEKIGNIEEDLKIIRDYEKGEQEAAIKKVDEFEISLKRLIDSYQSEANQANRKLENMIQTVKDQLRATFKQNVLLERGVIERYKSASNRITNLIENVRKQQKISIDTCQSLKNTIRQQSNGIISLQQRSTEEILRACDKLLSQISEIESNTKNGIDRFLIKRQTKTYETNKLIHQIIEQTTQN